MTSESIDESRLAANDQTGQDPTAQDRRPTTGRRTFLAGAGAAAIAGLAGACTDDTAGDPSSESSDQTADDQAVSGEAAGDQAESTVRSDPVPFREDRQQGLLGQPAAAGVVASFDVVDGSVTELADTLMALSAEVERLMAGTPIELADGDDVRPPADSGLLGGQSPPYGTAISLAVGASLFDDRFGLDDRRPSELVPMPVFFNDRLVQPELSHGDLALVISADSQQAVAHALHQVVRVTDRKLRLRWVQEGFNDLQPPVPGSMARSRNLMGFRDGTSNLDTTDSSVMDEHVWIQSADDEPDWATGGTYLAVRIIRMLIEFWSTAALVRQEQIFGRHRQSGAPIGQATEGEEPAFSSDPSDQAVSERSHIRRANPRLPGTGRILRRGFSYLNGVDPSGTLDQGLLFLAFQRSMSRGFLSAQSRLDGEPLEDYIKPVGGGFFYVLPGPGDDGWLGQTLLDG